MSQHCLEYCVRVGLCSLILCSLLANSPHLGTGDHIKLEVRLFQVSIFVTKCWVTDTILLESGEETSEWTAAITLRELPRLITLSSGTMNSFHQNSGGSLGEILTVFHHTSTSRHWTSSAVNAFLTNHTVLPWSLNTSPFPRRSSPHVELL